MDYLTNYPIYQQYGAFQHTQYPTGPGLSFPASPAAWRRHALIHHGSRPTESKPRLAKEEVDKLEREFQRNHKPNSSLKKQLAEEMRVELARINNWFQNRRAKAKQEKRAQENEARRKGEQGPSDQPAQDAVKEYYPGDDHHDDLRPSAAPFPTVNSPDIRESLESANQGGSEFSEEYNKNADLDKASPHSANQSSQSEEQSYGDCVATNGLYFPPESPCDFSSMATSQLEQQQIPTPYHLTLTIPEQYTPDPQETSSATSFASFPGLSSGSELEDAVASIPPHYPSSNLSTDLGDLAFDGERFHSSQQFPKFGQWSPESSHSPMPAAATVQFKPAAVDIASRRNTKRPAQLGSGCMRSYSYNQVGMKTGFEMPRRRDASSPVRRISSANTAAMPRGAIQRPVSATPRTGMYLDRNQENMLLHMASRTPLAPIPHGSAAPPTPNTPAIVHQGARELTVSSTSSEDEKRYTLQPNLGGHHFNPDPTMRTPPDTPGLLSAFPGAMFPSGQQLQTNLDYTVSDDSLITPGLGCFEADLARMPSAGVPGYVGQDCGSQPSTPAYPPASMGPAFFPSYTGGNAEYNWSDASTKSSPQQSKARQFQFTNMTAQDFHSE